LGEEEDIIRKEREKAQRLADDLSSLRKAKDKLDLELKQVRDECKTKDYGLHKLASKIKSPREEKDRVDFKLQQFQEENRVKHNALCDASKAEGELETVVQSLQEAKVVAEIRRDEKRETKQRSFQLQKQLQQKKQASTGQLDEALRRMAADPEVFERKLEETEAQDQVLTQSPWDHQPEVSQLQENIKTHQPQSTQDIAHREEEPKQSQYKRDAQCKMYEQQLQDKDIANELTKQDLNAAHANIATLTQDNELLRREKEVQAAELVRKDDEIANRVAAEEATKADIQCLRKQFADKTQQEQSKTAELQSQLEQIVKRAAAARAEQLAKSEQLEQQLEQAARVMARMTAELDEFKAQQLQSTELHQSEIKKRDGGDLRVEELELANAGEAI
jgi:hypothetical protein